MMGSFWGISNQRCTTSNTRQHPSRCDRPLWLQQAQAQRFLCWPRASDFTSPRFFSSLSPAILRSPLSGKHPKTTHRTCSSPGDSCACRRDGFIPAAHGQRWELCSQAAPRNLPIFKILPPSKAGGPWFSPPHTPHRCLPPGTNPLLPREWGPEASHQQCRHKAPRNSLPSPF